MKKKWGMAAIVVVFAGVFMFSLLKEAEDTQKINDIISEQSYVRVALGDGYHQSEVRFDALNDRAVVPANASWGLEKYRDGGNVGVNYGENEGVDVYRADQETNPELYLHFYFDSIRNLNLTVGEVRESGYYVMVVKRGELDWFEKELFILSGMVIDKDYELSGVGLEFDKKFRPVRKTFILQKKDRGELRDIERDSEKCTQEFSYNMGKLQFGMAFEKVKRGIEKVK